jgi:hypothetical protein
MRTTEMHSAAARLYLPPKQQAVLDRAYSEATKGMTLSVAEEAAIRDQAARQIEARSTGKTVITVTAATALVREALAARRSR